MRRAELQAKLVKHGVTATPQRLKIARILFAKPQHLSADQIRVRLRGSVSKATVYNTLHMFAEKGLVKEISVHPSRIIYDSSTHPHHHFYHVDTGELQDISADQVSVHGLPTLPKGTEQESVEVMIRIRETR